jgi:hypothetical protein
VRVAQALDLVGRFVAPGGIELEDSAESGEALASDAALGGGSFPELPSAMGEATDLLAQCAVVLVVGRPVVRLAKEHVVDALGVGLDVARVPLERRADGVAVFLGRVLVETSSDFRGVSIPANVEEAEWVSGIAPQTATIETRRYLELVSNPEAGIGDGEHHVGTCCHPEMLAGVVLVQFRVVRLKGQLSATRHGVPRVDDEVHDDLLDLRWVSLHLAQANCGSSVISTSAPRRRPSILSIPPMTWFRSITFGTKTSWRLNVRS